MKRPFDSQYATLILNLLTREFDHTQAYSLGIIGSDGMLKKNPESQVEKDAYTPLHQLTFGLKRILDSFPGSKNKLKKLAVAMNFIKRQSVPEQFKESIDYNMFLKELLLVVENDLCLPEEETMVEQFLKEDGESSVPTNQTANVDAHTPVIDKLFRRKKDEDGNITD